MKISWTAVALTAAAAYTGILPPALSLIQCVSAQGVRQSVLVLNNDNDPSTTHANMSPRRVAIIGAGAAGSSSAFFLNQAFSDAAMDLPPPEITIFESSDRIGGRVKVVNIPVTETDEDGNIVETTYPVEIGASMFVTVNKNLVDLAEQFNLTFNSNPSQPKQTRKKDQDTRPPVGIYNGSKFVFTASSAMWKTIVDALWRWGFYSPTKSRSLALEIGERFSSNYALAEAGELGFKNVMGLLKALKLDNVTRVEARQYFREQGVSEAYISEFIEPATRVNYGQNLDLHALSALVCLVAAFVETRSIKGGNEILFEEMVRRSGAAVKLNTKVASIHKIATQDGGKFYQVTDKNGGMHIFDAIILAVPSNEAVREIKFENIPTPQTLPFVHLHVTLVTGTLNPAYFHLSPAALSHSLPNAILTTNDKSLPFNSIGVREVLKDGVTTITKIFSPQPMNDTVLNQIYSKIVRVDRYEWDSYPYLKPREKMPDMELDVGSGLKGAVESWGGVFHVNAFEAAISTMESETVAARNVVQLLLRRWKGLPAADEDVDVGKTMAKL
ncbi:hypothetical protein HDV05_004835 [Chytridiales sp. JEL 0842]|nr:hypothetical protein HDV05_004835 [Chytridiales sp. JEL 0842]